MAPHEIPKPTPENLQFALPNQLMEGIIGALRVAKEMQDRANLDPLTGIPNRYALEESYAGLQTAERQRMHDSGQTETANIHSLLMVDIDHFKKINDTQGHDKGDRVLRKVAGLLDANTRKRDVVATPIDNEELAARIGGEEFAVLLPRAGSEQAVKVAEKLRRIAEEAGDVKLSIGVAGIDLRKSLAENLMNADTALYDAKKHGRNQVVRYEDYVERRQNGHAPHSA